MKLKVIGWRVPSQCLPPIGGGKPMQLYEVHWCENQSENSLPKGRSWEPIYKVEGHLDGLDFNTTTGSSTIQASRPYVPPAPAYSAPKYDPTPMSSPYAVKATEPKEIYYEDDEEENVADFFKRR